MYKLYIGNSEQRKQKEHNRTVGTQEAMETQGTVGMQGTVGKRRYTGNT